MTVKSRKVTKLPVKPAAKSEAQPLERFRGESQVKGLKRDVRSLLQQLHVADKRADVAEALKANARPPKPIKAPAKSQAKNLHKRVATPVFLCSDWHVEETVRPEKVGGLNEYNPEIATRRVDRLGDAMLWMINHHRKSFEIREAVLWLGGDLITGYIHDELKEGNALSPVQASLFVQDLVAGMLAKLLSVPGIERITVPCSYGNHGRTTVKSQIATGADNSYEWLIYQQLRRTYDPHARVQFYVADGEFLHLDVHGYDLGFTHGDAAKYGGGVGGIMIPVNKARAKWDTYKRADVWNLGHFHQLHDLPGVVINGSLIGPSPYGLRVGAYEAPAQASYLVDSKRGKCMGTTLWPDSSAHAMRKAA